MSKEKRKIVSKLISTESFYSILDGKTPEEVIDHMSKFRDMQGLDARDVYFNVVGYGYDGGLTLELYERREENDGEYTKRINEEEKVKAKNKKAKETKEARELAEFERLKKKFEGK